MILEKITSLKPRNLLDVGCGCGAFTAKLSPYCGTITAIDLFPSLIGKCGMESQATNINYICMDGRKIGFPDKCFDLVMERVSLHHISHWELVLDEMVRVSSRYVLAEEPIDDPRSGAKKNAIYAQRLYLEVQKEIGYPHNEHIALESLVRWFRTRGLQIDIEINKSDELIGFDEFFGSFTEFADKSTRRDYWYGRLESLKTELAGKDLARCDIAFVAATK